MGILKVRSTLGEESLIRKRKLVLAEKAFGGWEAFQPASAVHAAVGGVHVVFECRGAGAERGAKFLLDYFEDFNDHEVLASRVEVRFEICLPDSEEFNFRDPIWNEPEDSVSHLDGEEGRVWQVHRDLVGMRAAGDRVVSIMPCPEEGVTDGIDNLVGTFLPSYLIERGTFPLHAATVEHRGEAYVFFGASGAGKSTLAHYSADTLGMKMLGGDQIFIQIEQVTRKLYAHPCSTSVWDYPRSNPKLLVEKRPVAAFVNLVQRGDFSYRKLTNLEAMPLFLREIICPETAGCSERILRGVLEIFTAYSGNWIQMSYPRGENFWPELENSLK